MEISRRLPNFYESYMLVRFFLKRPPSKQAPTTTKEKKKSEFGHLFKSCDAHEKKKHTNEFIIIT